MGSFNINATGSFDKTEAYLRKLKSQDLFAELDKYGREGATLLASATPKRTGETADSWTYSIVNRDGFHSITWHNTNVNKGYNVALLIQYGHGTGTGGYVQGYDFINPVIRPLFDEIVDNVWKAVTSDG